MSFTPSNVACAAGGAALLFGLKQAFGAREAESLLPPGPATFPLIGNLFELTKEKGWLAPTLFRNWGREFGSDIVRANLFGQDIIVVNSQDAANELFEQRSSNYSQRPQMTALHKLLHFDWLALFMPTGQQCSDMRTAFQTYFRPSEYRGVETKAAHNLLRMIKAVPEDFMQHFRDTTGATGLAVAYGIEALPQDDFLVATAQKAVQALNHGTGADSIAFDAIPQLYTASAMLPGGSFKEEAENLAPYVRDCADFPMSHVRIHSRTGKARPSVALTMRTDSISKSHGADIAKQVPANIHFMNSSTMSSALSSFILAMLRNPEAQRNAQAEIDAIVGRNRLPEFEDAEFLPYVDAIVKEVLRWRPVAPMSVPHAAQETDVFQGFVIPKGAIVIGNAWAVLHDERVYPQPDKFKPERWLNKPKSSFPDAAFGFGGSRTCLGREFARDQLWITIASLLATFEIKKPVDEMGWTMEPEAGVTYSSTLFSHPSPFECQITPRSDAAALLIDETVKEGELTA